MVSQDEPGWGSVPPLWIAAALSPSFFSEPEEFDSKSKAEGSESFGLAQISMGSR